VTSALKKLEAKDAKKKINKYNGTPGKEKKGEVKTTGDTEDTEIF